MVANIRCAEIMEEQLAAFRGDPAWAALAEEAGQDLAAGFGQRAADLMDSCLEGECCAALCCACCACCAVLCLPWSGGCLWQRAADLTHTCLEGCELAHVAAPVP